VIGLLANMIIPVPEEVTLVTLGYLSATGVFHVVLIIPLLISGLLLSDLLIYFLSRKGSSITQKFYYRFFESQFSFLQNLDEKQLEKIIIFSRFFAFFRFLAPFLGGMYALPLQRFIQLEIMSITLYTTLYVGIGYYLRNQVEKIISGVNIVEHVIVAFVLLGVLSLLFVWLRNYFMQNTKLFRNTFKDKN
jgi:membrane protein DedA with SNARE-associated domain